MKYNISKDFGIFRHFHSSLNPLVLRFANVFLTIIPKGMKSTSNLSIKKMKISMRDDKKINIYIIKPKDAHEDLPVIFYFHGGAFAFKGAPYHYKYAKEYAQRSKAIVIYVDYRLSYCSPFGTTLNDCVDVYKYVLDNARLFGVDTERIAVAGDSAGGYLAVITTIKAKELGLKLPKLQILVYPVLDSRCKTASMETFVDTPFWNAKLNKKMWKLYLQGNYVTPPIELKDLYFMPKTYIETAEFDCLRDEAIEFFDKIQGTASGSVLFQTKQTMHGYDIFSKSKITKASLERRFEFLNTINS